MNDKKAARKILIIADMDAKMTSKELSLKWGLSQNYIQKLASQYLAKARLKAKETKHLQAVGLYAERDTAILQAFKVVRTV